ncbi:MAG: arginase [Anaerolineae bacterium]|nr:arginase [Anaerolineae bacterium]
MDLGQSRRGVDMGPSAVRYAGLKERIQRLSCEVDDDGNLIVPVVEEIPDQVDETNAHHLHAVVQVCNDLYQRAVDSIKTADFSIFLGGDHSMSVGSVSGVATQGKVGVIWVDAHADYNTPKTSPSGNVHGMPMAALLGDEPKELADIGHAGAKLQPQQVVMIGIRNLDAPERQRLIDSGITIHTMTDIDEHGVGQITRRTLEHFANYDHIHVSLDMDSLDPEFAPGVGTPIPGGLTYREAHLLMEILHSSGKVRSMDIVEINPILDNRNRTAELAVELAASLLGQRII